MRACHLLFLPAVITLVTATIVTPVITTPPAPIIIAPSAASASAVIIAPPATVWTRVSAFSASTVIARAALIATTTWSTLAFEVTAVTGVPVGAAAFAALTPAFAARVIIAFRH